MKVDVVGIYAPGRDEETGVIAIIDPRPPAAGPILLMWRGPHIASEEHDFSSVL